MDDAKLERWGALGGIVFVVLVAVTAILPGSPPKTSDSAAKMVKYFVDNGDAIRWSAYIGGVATIFLFWWLGSVWRLIRRADGGAPLFAVVAISGAVFASVAAAVSGILLAVIPIVGVEKIGPEGVRFFYIFGSNLGVATGFGAAVFIGAFSIAILRSGVLPTILGWIGLLIALVAIVGGSVVATTKDAVFFISFVGFIAFMIWVLIVSILMLRGARETSVTPVESAA